MFKIIYHSLAFTCLHFNHHHHLQNLFTNSTKWHEALWDRFCLITKENNVNQEFLEYCISNNGICPRHVLNLKGSNVVLKANFFSRNFNGRCFSLRIPNLNQEKQVIENWYHFLLINLNKTHYKATQQVSNQSPIS